MRHGGVEFDEPRDIRGTRTRLVKGGHSQRGNSSEVGRGQRPKVSTFEQTDPYGSDIILKDPLFGSVPLAEYRIRLRTLDKTIVSWA
jgi:hypothetical protein